MDRQGMILELNKRIGKGKVQDNGPIVAQYFRDRRKAPGLIVAYPETVEDVQAVLEVAPAFGGAVFTTYDTYLDPSLSTRSGVILGFQRMNRIEKIDEKNLTAFCQRGVTLLQLQAELDRKGLRIMVPAAATSASVVENFVNRVITMGAARISELQVSNMLVVLADGRIHKTGSHALSEEIADYKEDMGPYVSKWYYGAGDIFGIVTRATVLIYPKQPCRKFLVYGVSGEEDASALIKEVSRKELCSECLAMNAQAVRALVQQEQGDIPPWVVVLGFEAFPELVAYQEKMVAEMLGRDGARPLVWLIQGLSQRLEAPVLIINQPRIAFYTLFSRIREFTRIIEEGLVREGYNPEAVGRILIAVGTGRAVYCGYDLLKGSLHDFSMCDSVNASLIEHGAFFDRPLGRAAQEVYSRAPAYLEQIRRIKQIMDPGNCINPDQPIPLYPPPA